MAVPLIDIANNKDKFPTIGNLFGENGKEIALYQIFSGLFEHFYEVDSDLIEILPCNTIREIINNVQYNEQIFTPIIRKKLAEIPDYLLHIGNKNDLVISITLSGLKYQYSGHKFVDIKVAPMDIMKGFIVKCRLTYYQYDPRHDQAGEEKIKFIDLFKQWDQIHDEDRVMICTNKLIPRIMDELEEGQRRKKE